VAACEDAMDTDDIADRVAQSVGLDEDQVAEKAAEKVFESIDIDEMLMRVAWKIQDSKRFDERLHHMLEERFQRYIDARANA
jgi:hypothetical protein